jgi:hypothetical protein
MKKAVIFALLAVLLAGCGTQVCNGKRQVCYDNCGICPEGK